MRALISVSDKTGLTGFAAALRGFGAEILSTGGTARQLREAGIDVVEVAAHTGFPEMMDGRVKTLHPRIHGGILGRRGIDDAVMATHDIAAIDLVVVNLYPFERTVADPACDLTTAIENIDIGGPAMLRSAAKNHRDVAVIVDPADYAAVLVELSASGRLSDASRYSLAVKAFAHTARYDGEIANYLSARDLEGQRTAFPQVLTLQFDRREVLRYGENPHQRAAFYVERAPVPGSIATARQLQGKELSFNNIADADAALDCVRAFVEPACVIVKHANPCGAAVAADPLTAYERAYRTDPTSAYGGIIAFNRPLTASIAEAIIARQFVEVIIAPAVEDDVGAVSALNVLAGKGNIRVLVTGDWDATAPMQRDYKRVTGGLLMQDRDITGAPLAPGQLKTVTRRAPSAAELRDLEFAWVIVTAVKSNAIVYARDRMTIGVGAGQMSRVVSARIASMKAADANLAVAGSVMASDAFFPFRDGIDAAAADGITAVIAPGGSVGDADVIKAADEHDMAMVFTGVRHFRH